MAEIMYRHALRINSLIGLKASSLKILPKLSLFDNKTSYHMVIICEKNICNELYKLIRNEDDYLFFPSIKKQRAKQITQIMNNQMKEVFKNEVDSSMIVASHCFRKGAANILADEIFKDLTNRVGSFLGHRGKSSLGSYLDLNERHTNIRTSII